MCVVITCAYESLFPLCSSVSILLVKMIDYCMITIRTHSGEEARKHLEKVANENLSQLASSLINKFLYPHVIY